MRLLALPFSSLLLLSLFLPPVPAFPRPFPIPQAAVPDGSSRELIGDLRTVGPVTPVGRTIANIIMGSESGQSSVTADKPNGSAACGADPCCVWFGGSFLSPVRR